MAEEEKGYMIRGQFYPASDRFGLTDAILIKDLTGMSFSEFSDLYDGLLDGSLPDEDAIALIPALVGVAIWRANRRWKRDRVITFVQSLDYEDVERVGGEEDEEGEEERPPDQPDEEKPGSEPSSESSKSEDSTPTNGTIQPPSGTLESVIGSPA